MTAGNNTLTTEMLAAWSSRLADILASPADTETPRKLGMALRQIVPFDASSSFALRKNSAPLTFFDDLPSGIEPVRYAEKPYLLDPVYISFLKDELPVCCCTLDEICPDGFRESDYFHRYWLPVDIVSEFSFNIPCDSNTILHLSMLRRGASPSFSAGDIERLKALTPLVATAMLAHWESRKDDLSAGHEDADAFHTHLSYVLQNFGASVLTNREKEVVHLTMRGYSDKLTARELNITPGTVRNHKKSIFSKLGVSSQGQVFGLFLKALQLPTPADDNTDPVAALLARH